MLSGELVLPAPIPARMVNEYSHCPRLFYLEFVQQEGAYSVDTRAGRFVHWERPQEFNAAVRGFLRTLA